MVTDALLSDSSAKTILNLDNLKLLYKYLLQIQLQTSRHPNLYVFSHYYLFTNYYSPLTLLQNMYPGLPDYKFH